MKIGLSSASFYPKVLTEDSIKIMTELGFSSGEIFLNSPCEYSEAYIDKLSKITFKYGFSVNSLHAFCAAFEPFLFEEYERRRDDMFKYFKMLLRCCNQIGAKCYTFHGMRLTKDGKYNKKIIEEVYNKLTYTAAEFDIKLCQENVSWCMSKDLNYLKFIKEKCKYPVYFTLDIKQAYKAFIPPTDYLKVMGENLMNLHLNDKDRSNICLLPGCGDVDFYNLKLELNKIKYKGIGIIEVYRDNFDSPKELIKSREYLEGIFN